MTTNKTKRNAWAITMSMVLLLGVCLPAVAGLPDGSEWTQATAAPPWEARLSPTSLVYDDRMWVLGGSDGSGPDGNSSFLNDVWSSTDGVTWTEATAAAPWVARQGHTSLVYDNRMWILGGNDGDTGSSNRMTFGSRRTG